MPETAPGTVSEEDKKTLIDRLARVEGQLRGVQRMIADEKDCEAIAQQLADRDAVIPVGRLHPDLDPAAGESVVIL